jgi:ribonuclease E
MVEGRGLFDDERAKAVAAIAKVRGADAVKDQAGPLDTLLADADKLGAYDTRKFDEGVRQLQAIEQKAAVWTGLAKTVAAYRKDEAAVTAELDALDKHAAAARIATERQAIRGLLDAAKNQAAQAPAAPDPAAAWAGAVASLARARTDLGVAKKTAESLGVAAAAENAAKNPADTAALGKALQNLAADAKIARKAAGADLAADAFKRFDEKVALASQALQANDGAKAAPLLTAAAAALAEAKVIQAGHAQLVAARPAIEADLKALKKSKRAGEHQGQARRGRHRPCRGARERPGACRHRGDGGAAPRQRRPGRGEEGRCRPQALRRRGRGARQAHRREQGRRRRARDPAEARRRRQGARRRIRFRRRGQGAEGARGAPRQGQARSADGEQGQRERTSPSSPARWSRTAAPRPSTR